MTKLFFFLLLFVNLLQADWLYSNENICIKNFYILNDSFYYQLSSNDTWLYTFNNNQAESLLNGFSYDIENGICKINSELLGLSEEDFNFVNSLVAFLVCLLLIWSLL